MRLRLIVPASAGNNGPGFDCFGLAYGLYNELIVDTERPGRIDVEGEGAEDLARGAPNLVCRALDTFESETGKKVPRHGLRLINRIPFCRGLGGSAAAIVGGLLAGDALTGAGLGRDDLLALALRLEDHPDNVSAALVGGAVLTVFEDRVGGPFTVRPLRVPGNWRAAVLVPDHQVVTREARALLPEQVPRRDAIFNHSRVGLLVAALLEDRPEDLRRAMQDRIHQPYRSAIIPEMNELIRAALEAGAYGSCLSGAGPSILALAHRERAKGVAAAMQDEAVRQKVAARSFVLDLPASGARVEIERP